MFGWAEKLFAAQAEGLVRHALNGIGAALVTKGVMTSDQSSAVVGGVMALAAVLWSLWQKHQALTSKIDATHAAFLDGVKAASPTAKVITGAFDASSAGGVPVAERPPGPADLKGLY